MKFFTKKMAEVPQPTIKKFVSIADKVDNIDHKKKLETRKQQKGYVFYMTTDNNKLITFHLANPISDFIDLEEFEMIKIYLEQNKIDPTNVIVPNMVYCDPSWYGKGIYTDMFRYKFKQYKELGYDYSIAMKMADSLHKLVDNKIGSYKKMFLDINGKNTPVISIDGKECFISKI